MTTSAIPGLNRLSPIATRTEDATLRDFSGGLKIVESDVTLKSKYATVLSNMFTNEDYSQVLRFGTRLFGVSTTTIVGGYYFAGVAISVLSDGTIEALNDVGTSIVIWNNTIASALPGAPSGWVGSSKCTFTEDNGKLIIQNGVDKPLIVSRLLVVDYLQDLATLTNINTPIALHGAMVGDYFVVATDDDDPTIIISSKGTSGTFTGDAAPNDATSKRLGSYVSKGNGNIRALVSFRNRLLVFLESAVIVVELGIYDDTGTHVPNVVDTIFGIGTLNHNTTIVTEKDLFFLSKDGVHSATRSVLSGNFEAKPLSDDILPLLNDYLPRIYQSDAKGCFIVHDKFKRKLFFVLTFEGTPDTTACFVMNYSANFKTVSWSVVDGWDFTGGFETERKRVILYTGNEFYQYGNDVYSGENFYADYINKPGGPAEGVDIAFDWEFPWLDINQRVSTKQLLKITGDTLGTAQFTLEIYTDKAYKNDLGVYIPALTLDMRAGSSGGFGLPSGGFGGGRRISDERFYGVPVRFKIMKLRIKGSTKDKLLMNSLSIIYRKGRYHR